MTTFSLLLLAASLAVDAAAVAAARGMALHRVPLQRVLSVGLVFGGFHALMPSMGWLAGDTLGGVLGGMQAWLAAGVFTVLGGKMAWDGVRGMPRESTGDVSMGALIPAGFATSVDAAAAGVAFPALDVPMLGTVVLIGSVTALLSGAGVMLGRQLGAVMGGRAEMVGGVVLMAMGVMRVVD